MRTKVATLRLRANPFTGGRYWIVTLLDCYAVDSSSSITKYDLDIDGSGSFCTVEADIVANVYDLGTHRMAAVVDKSFSSLSSLTHSVGVSEQEAVYALAEQAIRLAAAAEGF